MKLHIITVGAPKQAYAKAGWTEYWTRLTHYHHLRVTHIPDKHNDTAHIRAAVGQSYSVGLVIEGKGFTSPELARFMDARSMEGREVSFIIGGPDGLQAEIRAGLNFAWSLSELTFPHDLAMIVLLESLYRASTISAGLPYHH